MWVLIIVFLNGDSGMTSQQIEYKTQIECEGIRGQLKKHYLVQEVFCIQK